MWSGEGATLLAVLNFFRHIVFYIHEFKIYGVVRNDDDDDDDDDDDNKDDNNDDDDDDNNNNNNHNNNNRQCK